MWWLHRRGRSPKSTSWACWCGVPTSLKIFGGGGGGADAGGSCAGGASSAGDTGHTGAGGGTGAEEWTPGCDDSNKFHSLPVWAVVLTGRWLYTVHLPLAYIALLLVNVLVYEFCWHSSLASAFVCLGGCHWFMPNGLVHLSGCHWFETNALVQTM
ncbi:unnamed protein product, partial [Phaeothamnion confervicola]